MPPHSTWTGVMYVLLYDDLDLICLMRFWALQYTSIGFSAYFVYFVYFLVQRILEFWIDYSMKPGLRKYDAGQLWTSPLWFHMRFPGRCSVGDCSLTEYKVSPLRPVSNSTVSPIPKKVPVPTIGFWQPNIFIPPIHLSRNAEPCSIFHPPLESCYLQFATMAQGYQLSLRTHRCCYKNAWYVMHIYER